MKKILAFVLLSFFAVNAWTQRPLLPQRPPLPVEQCQVHSPYGFAQNSKSVFPICRHGYLIAYDQAAKIPNYVAYTLLPQNALGCFPRTNAFVADQSIKNGPTPTDYSNSGFDKGHAAPNGDLSWDQQIEYESFLMTNMFPQHGSLNRGIWKLLETSIRGWVVQRNQSFTIYTGAIYGPGNRTIGKGVVVPNGFYKIVINNATKEVAGWSFPHNPPYPNLGTDLRVFRKPIDSIHQEAGVQFAYPANAKELQPGREWDVNFGALINSKRQKCGANSSTD